ncbi:ABC transporter ATP-binding protein [Treponema denticola]|uniref:ABC transporter ATP-binding protein n=1 Tax=Treponema denticola TaxID=158 RepID=UPI0020A2AC8F|nr:ABC transporter ATP-binding protein [Treponema denticola]UTC93493.1 ABC transporter ATP-binding protein [Treponema denticola]UTC98474.1 ABC transporter ATP-binding protein [Treponema denticola]
MSAIVTAQLTKKYGGITAVDNLNLTVEQGELFALLGVNGAGKTTTIKMLSCLIKPTSGDALLLGNSIISASHTIKKKINISPQETAVAANLSVLENLELIAGIYGQDSKTAKKNAYEIAQKFKLENELNKKAKHLSGGMQRRLSIAMALISDPQILFLDEPTLGLDVLARRELWASIKELKGKVTIILTTHYMDEVETLSDRVGIMSKGKLKAMGTVQELTMQTDTVKLEDAFVTLSGGVL